MNVEQLAIAAGILGGAIALVGLYLLASKKAAKTGEQAIIVFVWSLSLLSLLHGLALCLITAVVWLGASLLVGTGLEIDYRFMGMMILAGVVFLFIGGIGLQTRRHAVATRPRS
jgi:hypothetical protein